MKLRLLAALLVASLACRDSTSPKKGRLAPVYGIEVPPSVAVNDTLSIGFRYSKGCEELEHMAVSQTAGGIVFAIWITNNNWPCLAFVEQEGSHIQLVLPPRSSAFTVRFRQTPRDSVLVINTAP